MERASGGPGRPRCADQVLGSRLACEQHGGMAYAVRTLTSTWPEQGARPNSSPTRGTVPKTSPLRRSRSHDRSHTPQIPAALVHLCKLRSASAEQQQQYPAPPPPPPRRFLGQSNSASPASLVARPHLSPLTGTMPRSSVTALLLLVCVAAVAEAGAAAAPRRILNAPAAKAATSARRVLQGPLANQARTIAW